MVEFCVKVKSMDNNRLARLVALEAREAQSN